MPCKCLCLFYKRTFVTVIKFNFIKLYLYQVIKIISQIAQLYFVTRNCSRDTDLVVMKFCLILRLGNDTLMPRSRGWLDALRLDSGWQLKQKRSDFFANFSKCRAFSPKASFINYRVIFPSSHDKQRVSTVSKSFLESIRLIVITNKQSNLVSFISV